MKEIYLTRNFLKRPIYTVGLFLLVILIMEGLSWTSVYKIKLAQMIKLGGMLTYVGLLFRTMILPELCTAYILTTLINQYHIRFGIKSIPLTMRAIGQYQLRLLPVLLLAFFVFNPFTETVRFFLERFPDYTVTQYWHEYLRGTFTPSIYIRYVIPIVLIGYTITNISLLSDYFQQRQEAQEAAESKAAMALEAAHAVIAAQLSAANGQPTSYLSHLKGRGKNQNGELDFPVQEVYFFTTEERFYYAQLAKGQYLIGKTLNELEAELDPNLFFRIKRDYIVNRHSVLNYAYWENGKYIVRLDTPDRHEIVVPRARMQEFREWLQGNQKPYADSATDSFMLAL